MPRPCLVLDDERGPFSFCSFHRDGVASARQDAQLLGIQRSLGIQLFKRQQRMEPWSVV